MTDNLSEYYDQPPKKTGLSTGAKVGIGCAATFIIVTVLICGGAWWMWSASWAPYDAFGDEFEQQGYARMDGRAMDITRVLSGPHVLVGMAINVETDVEGDLAVASYAANIEGTVHGDLDFYGLVLNIAPGARITGNVRIRSAEAVNIEGEIDRELTGKWTSLQDSRRTPAPAPESPEDPAVDPDGP